MSTRDKHARIQNNFEALPRSGDRGSFQSLRHNIVKLSALKEHLRSKIG